MEPIGAPQEALNNVLEAGVLTYRRDPRRRTVTLVTDYPFTSPGSEREFIAFVFEDAEFERVPGDHEPYQKYQDFFQSSGPGAFVIQNIRQEPVEPGRQRVELWLGPNFGGVVITYARLRAYTRGSTVAQAGPMTWQYRDSRTNEPFEFAYPFPSLAPPV